MTELANGAVDAQGVGGDAGDGVTGRRFLELPQGGAGGGGPADLTVVARRLRLRVLAQHAVLALERRQHGGQTQS